MSRSPHSWMQTQPIVHSEQHQVNRPRDPVPVGVPSCSSCSPLQLHEHVCSSKGSRQTGLCRPSPRDVISHICPDVHIPIPWDQGGERKWSWERIWTRANLTQSLSLCCSLSVPLSFLWVPHNFVFMFVMTFSASSQKAQRLRAECPLQPQTSQKSGFCVYLHFLNHCKGAIFTSASC